MNRQIVDVNSAQINLQQFLKWANIVMSGGEAKQLILQGLVQVNGQVETRRRRKLTDGDVVTVADSVELVVRTR